MCSHGEDVTMVAEPVDLATANKNKRRLRRMDSIRLCCQSGSDFLDQTSMHGFKHIKDPQSAQKFFWLVSCALAISFSCYLISQIFLKWQSNPILVSFDTSPTPIWEISFPAVTFCNMNQVKRSQMEDVRRRVAHDREDVDAAIKASLIEDRCGTDLGVRELNVNGSSLQSWMRHGHDSGYLERLGHSCEEMVVRCAIAGTNLPCRAIFKHLDTDLGRCCVFNLVDNAFVDHPTSASSASNSSSSSSSASWDQKHDYNSAPDRYNASGLVEVPYRSLNAGQSSGVSFVLDLQANETFCSSSESQGFKVMLHNPTSVPGIEDYGFVLQNGLEYFIPISPNVIHADPGIEHIDPYVRQCFLAHERRLKHFRHYTKLNCFAECKSNHTFDKCGCVPAFLPHSADQHVCTPDRNQCVRKVLRELSDNAFDRAGAIFACDCIETCNELSYDYELSQTPIGGAGMIRWPSGAPRPEYSRDDYVRSNLAVVNIFFKGQVFLRRKRSELYDALDFFSNIGGLLSLCMGFSALSVIEIFYFFCFRIFCQRKKTHEYGSA